MVLVDGRETPTSIVSVLDDEPVNQHLQENAVSMHQSDGAVAVDLSEDLQPTEEEEGRRRDHECTRLRSSVLNDPFFEESSVDTIGNVSQLRFS